MRIVGNAAACCPTRLQGGRRVIAARLVAKKRTDGGGDYWRRPSDPTRRGGDGWIIGGRSPHDPNLDKPGQIDRHGGGRSYILMKYVLSFLGLAHLKIYTKPLQNGRFVQLFYVVICRKKNPLPERTTGLCVCRKLLVNRPYLVNTGSHW